MEIRDIKEKEMSEALKLVWETFLIYEAPDYTEEGIEEFRKVINDQEWISKRFFKGAFIDEKIVGVIATYNINHIALFFVDGNYHRMGIGKKLYKEVELLNNDDYFTVNSSPYAHEIYKHLGFFDTDSEQCIHGLRFFPMKKELVKEKKRILCR